MAYAPFLQAGFNAGDSVLSFELPGSGTDDLLDIDTASNTGVLGRFVYRVDQEEILGFICTQSGRVGLNPPSGVMMGGTLVSVLGPCYTEVSNLDIVCKFGDVTVPGTLKSEFIAECCTPTCLQVGPVNVEVSLDNGNTFPFNGVFIYGKLILDFTEETHVYINVR
ncbi:hypothetical protein HOLleu_01607 [Holothuria leucospilota]|uniref:NIDO domain-containing protein n=1 Tax=Holothuria leucospilota TaxID=206669 RepID=A0A9Q1HKC9_HOLLE|nr:hypothetical protein HOLleu_01607 [Holothuria leucospilota]